MTDPDLIRLFVAPLEELGIPYMITGGVAAVIYGDPPFTRDIDLVLDLDAEDAPRLAAAFAGGAHYVPIEYVIVRKLSHYRASGSDRHLRDVAAMLEVSGDLVNRVDLSRWLERMGLTEIFDEASNFQG